jgi:hypothetical protein
VHALLLFGSEGAGQEEASLDLASTWLCTRPTSEGACGVCQACGARSRSANPDIQIIEPQPPSQIIKLGAIVPQDVGPPPPTQPLSIFFRVPPLMSRHKVAVLRDPERMNKDAANAFLKMLEEPLPYVKIVMTTSAIGSVLPTVRSRCLTVVCELPTREDMAANIGVPLPDWALRAPDCLRLQVEDPERHQALEEFVTWLGQAGPESVLLASERFRELCGRFQEDKENARSAQSTALAVLALLVHDRYPDRPLWAQAVIETHRRVLGNGSALFAFDALFSQMMCGQR